MSGGAGRNDVLVERRATFEPELTSAGAARRLLQGALQDAGRQVWLDAGELAISEVVTNAVLHGHTVIDVAVAVRRDRLHVEVADRNPTLPHQRDYDDHATTGRGMGLVAAVSRECGIRSLGDDGKVTWFTIGGDGEPVDVDPLAAWDVDDDWPEDGGQAGMTTITLEAMPATLWLSARQHHDAILRELVLYIASHDEVRVDHAAADFARGQISNALLEELGRAEASGTVKPVLPAGHPSPLPWVPEAMDLVVTVADSAGASFAALQDTLDVAERLAVEGELLVRPGLPEIVAVRDWACEQVTAQLAGNTPVPWAGAAQERFETDVISVPDRTAAWDATAVLESDRGLIAADDANRIVAVSRPLADLLGWEPAALVGRRIVTIVPPSLREAHVAGFSRHLSTGESHILGVDLELPVWRADGTEVRCRVRIERATAPHSRSIYLAWIDPVPAPG